MRSGVAEPVRVWFGGGLHGDFVDTAHDFRVLLASRAQCYFGEYSLIQTYIKSFWPYLVEYGHF